MKRQTQLEAEDRLVFSKMLALGLGSVVELAKGPGELFHFGRLADYYQINIVAEIVEEIALKLLSKQNSMFILSQIHGTRVAKAGREGKQSDHARL